ncbi:hypothetical protein AX15_004648 [Amanita polypyramis BW_CC]|nr:hypothetical protein AX15_004648 [Amanita polypyramis BW_CC]
MLLVCASFRSLSLFLLAFSPSNRSLSLVQRIPAFGPHQYIALGPNRERIYTTTWAYPPALHSWAIDTATTALSFLVSAPITATSSYISIPPPYTHIYSTGGPTGEVHLLDASGTFGNKIQEFLFIPDHQLPTADKTRIALRYGSHAIEFSHSLKLAFIPVLGSSSIEVYAHNSMTGFLDHLSSVPSPRGSDAHDGPRHVKVHPNGRVLYCVTEHSNYVDAYAISSSAPHLKYHSSRSLVPSSLRDNVASFRGDTLLLSSTSRTLFATTRGSTTNTRGWITIFALDENGLFLNDDTPGVERYQTSTSGGKAHAIDLLLKTTPNTNDNDTILIPGMNIPQIPLDLGSEAGEAVLILLTDDDDSTVVNGGGVRVLEWDGWGTGGIREVAAWPDPLSPREQEQGREQDVEGDRMLGGSHAIWL